MCHVTRWALASLVPREAFSLHALRMLCALSGSSHPALNTEHTKASAEYIGWLYRDARKQRHPDTTVYGSHRASPRSFYSHHLAAISHAIVIAEALSIVAAASCMVAALASTSRLSAPAAVRMVGIAA